MSQQQHPRSRKPNGPGYSRQPHQGQQPVAAKRNKRTTITKTKLKDGSVKKSIKTETQEPDGSTSVAITESIERPTETKRPSISGNGQDSGRNPSSAHVTKTTKTVRHIPASGKPEPQQVVARGDPSAAASQTSNDSMSQLGGSPPPGMQQPQKKKKTGFMGGLNKMLVMTVNGSPIQGAAKAAFMAMGIMPGHYWRDFASGMYGYEGGPTLGVSHVPIPGAGLLQPDASCKPPGQTSIFINGREVHPMEVMHLLPIMMIPGSRWQVDMQLTVYNEATGMVVGSLQQVLAKFQAMAAQRSGGSGGGGSSCDDPALLAYAAGADWM